MAGDSKQNLKQLRVDNWAVFFLQRLQLLFAKGDCCDLTLKFVNGQELKVHRLVLSTSTSFFESMESKGNVIHLPESLPYNVVHPIINFLYSGRLEFKAELHPQLLSIAKIMKLAILARILISQKNDNGFGDHNASPGKVVDMKKVKYKAPSQNKSLTPASSYVNVIAGKKLPIWKKRTVPYNYERKPVKEEEPRPTRFEWPDDETSSSMLLTSPSFTLLSYESAPVISPPVTPPALQSDSLPTTSLKRRVMPPLNNSIPDKIFKPDGNVTTTNSVSKSNDIEVTGNENVSDDDYDDDGHFETIHSYGDSDDDPDTPSDSEILSSHLKPILKPMTDSPVQTPSKKVRFTFTPEDKENKSEKTVDNCETPKNAEKKDISNHAKIIKEVLKKYPELVKNNKNIKLKITAPGSGSKQETITIDTKKKPIQGKSSYIVLKKTETTSNPPSEPIEKATRAPKSIVIAQGPWKCEACTTGGKVLKFGSYHDYKKHMQDAHTGVDSRICEYCGYKASKRNLHLYHLYTKHGIEPPKNIKFPKCTQCSYIALSDSLLIKHLNNHQIARDLTCQLCNTTFKTYSSLHVHSLSCKPNSEVRSHPCPNCKKVFKTNVSLNAHIKVCTVGNEDDEDEESPTSTEIIEVPIIEAVELNKEEQQAIVQIPSGIILAETPNVALLPSETEALNSVSSIATSIGLTVAIPQEHEQAVILLDGNSQFFLQGNESMVVSDDSAVGEYIVPEILRDEMGQIYTTQNVPYTVSSTGVITCPIMSIQSTNELCKEKPNSSGASISREQHNIELKTGTEFSSDTSILESVDSHLQSSNTRVEIKDSQADLDVAQLEKALLSPEPPSDTEAIDISNNVIEGTSNCEVSSARSEPDDHKINIVGLYNEVEPQNKEVALAMEEVNPNVEDIQNMEDEDVQNEHQEHQNKGQLQTEEEKQQTKNEEMEHQNEEEEQQTKNKEMEHQNEEEEQLQIEEEEQLQIEEEEQLQIEEEEQLQIEEEEQLQIEEEEQLQKEKEEQLLNGEAEQLQNEAEEQLLNEEEEQLLNEEEEQLLNEEEEQLLNEAEEQLLNEEQGKLQSIEQEKYKDEAVEHQQNKEDDQQNEDERNKLEMQEHQNEIQGQKNEEETNREVDHQNTDIVKYGDVQNEKDNSQKPESINETSVENNQNDKAISLVRDWGFDNEEDNEDDIEDSESRPSRPTVELDF